MSETIQLFKLWLNIINMFIMDMGLDNDMTEQIRKQSGFHICWTAFFFLSLSKIKNISISSQNMCYEIYTHNLLIMVVIRSPAISSDDWNSKIETLQDESLLILKGFVWVFWLLFRSTRMSWRRSSYFTSTVAKSYDRSSDISDLFWNSSNIFKEFTGG